MLELCDVSGHTAAGTGTVVILIETAIGSGAGTITSTSTGFCSDVGTSMGIGIGGACAFFLT